MKIKEIFSVHNTISIIILISSVIVLWRALPRVESLQEDLYSQRIFEAKVLKIISEKETTSSFPNQRTLLVQTLLVEVNLTDKQKQVTILNDFIPVQEGQNIYVKASGLDTEDESFDITDVKRQSGMLWLVLLFVFFSVTVGGVKGAKAIIGLIASLAVIFGVIIPRILAGENAITVSLLSSLVIVFVSIYLTNGISRKSFIAIGGIFVTIIFTAWLTHFAIMQMHFTGYSGEEAFYLNAQTGSVINLVGILVAGIIISALGVLDDVAVTQVAIVGTLAHSNPVLHKWELFKRAMSVGRDHIAAVINTLALAYVGASLPLLLLLTTQQFAIGFTINTEIVATEIVRTLISTSALVLSVPITTLLAAFFLSLSQKA